MHCPNMKMGTFAVRFQSKISRFALNSANKRSDSFEEKNRWKRPDHFFKVDIRTSSGFKARNWPLGCRFVDKSSRNLELISYKKSLGADVCGR